jgi:hypothetical protein
MKTKIHLVIAIIITLSACKKNDNFTEIEQRTNIVKEWVNKQQNASIVKETITVNNRNAQVITLDWDAQIAFQKNNRNFIEIPYTYADKTKSDRYLVVELKNSTIVAAKMKHVSLISYLDNTYFAEYWYDAKGQLSELWQWSNNKFTKLDISSFNSSQATSRTTTSCYQMSGTYWTYANTSDGVGIIATSHTYYYTLCIIGVGTPQDESLENNFGGGSGGGGGSPTDPNADIITETLDKDCLKNAFTLIQNTQNIGGTPILKDIKNTLGSSSLTFNWDNSALGTSNSNLYSTVTSNGNGGYNITLNNSTITSASNEFISAVILNSYAQGFTTNWGNTWANNQNNVSGYMNSLANGLRQLHGSLPQGAEYAIALKVFYDGNSSMFNQTQLATQLNTYYINLVNSGKIPMVGNPSSPNYQPAPDYNGWQVAKNNVGAKYATNATIGTPAICN